MVAKWREENQVVLESIDKLKKDLEPLYNIRTTDLAPYDLSFIDKRKDNAVANDALMLFNAAKLNKAPKDVKTALI